MSDHTTVNRATLSASFRKLQQLPETATRAEKQDRGRKFEQLLNQLFKFEGLAPRLRFRPGGEEVDLSVIFNHHTYLVEAKWHTAELAASTLYQFRGKVDGKLVGTIGIFVSMSGYSKDAVDALMKGKTSNLILFGGEDVSAIFSDSTFSDVLAFKLRIAAEEGELFAP